MSEFARRLKKLRTDNKMTQQELAAILNVSQNAIYNWENEKREPSLDMILKIANSLNVPVEYLFEPIDLGFITDKTIEQLDYLLSKGEKDFQSIFLQNNYLLTQQDNNYFLQKCTDGVHGKKIKLTENEYKELKNDIDFFINYLVEKLFANHDYYFGESD